MEAHLLSINEFNKPKVISGASAGYVNLIYLILLPKGKFQSHPLMGVGIRERYRDNNDTDVLINLQADIRSQVETYLPELRLLDVDLSINGNHVLMITINTTEGAYALQYNSQTEEITVANEVYTLDDL